MAGIITLLTDPKITKSHQRHIPMPVCKESGLKIFEMEGNQEIQDTILSIHHASVLTVMNTSAIKIIDNHKGSSYVTMYD